MKNTGSYCFWDIILADYKFTEWTGSKLRPVVVLFRDREDYTVLKMTTQDTQTKDSLTLGPDDDNCLKVVTYIKMDKINTFHESLFLRKIGHINATQKKSVKNYLINRINDL